ncbi:MAG: VCBS repeat-containing protein [Polyangiales bacterium]
MTERDASSAAPRRVLLRRGGDDGIALMDVPLTVEGAWPRRISAAGDIDGDGFGDLLGIDPPDDGKPGRAVVYFGNAEGLHPVPSALSLGEADLAAVSISTRGDLDGDGLPDMLVGEPTRGGGAGAASAWINGGACGEGTLRPLAATTSSGASLGASVAATGDFDADGYVDPVVGAPFSVLSNDQSLLWLYRGAVSAATAPTSLAFPSAQREGFTLGAGGDVDGDGYGDLVVWMHNLQRGPMMFVFRGGAEGLARTATTILPQQYGSTETAISFRSVGDTDRDGRDDLIVMLSPGHVVLARGTPEGVTVGPLPAMTLP